MTSSSAAGARPVELAQIGQYAENVYFGKPCGLMDQTASSVGGVVAIDFADPAAPVVEQINLDLEANGYALCILDSGRGPRGPHGGVRRHHRGAAGGVRMLRQERPARGARGGLPGRTASGAGDGGRPGGAAGHARLRGKPPGQGPGRRIAPGRFRRLFGPGAGLRRLFGHVFAERDSHRADRPPRS